MKRSQMENSHKAILTKYGLQNIPTNECQCLIFEPGETIVQMGLRITHLYLAVNGRAKAFRLSDNGKRLIVCQYISNGMIGEIELLTGKREAMTTVTAISGFSCVAISSDRCLKELKSNLDFSNMLGYVLAEKLMGSANNYVLSALYTGEQRLCSYILQNANASVFRETLTEVAASVGMSYRHMLRIFSDLCDRRILQKKERGFFILNKTALQQLSGNQDHP